MNNGVIRVETCKIDGCKNKIKARELCSGHYTRLNRHGDPGIKKKKWREKLDYKISDTGCFEVTSHKPGIPGYPQMNFGGKKTTAHRKVYEEMFGEIPKGLVVRHKCDNRICINPEHLEIGTPADNMRDMYERNREARGEKNGSHKLKEIEVREIKEALKEKVHLGQNVRFLAEKYQVSRTTIYSIYHKKAWKHL